MGEPKAFASLSSGLLARKGAARPAMRPQGFGQLGAGGLDDLGWNDMGFEAPRPSIAPVRDDSHDAFGDEISEPALRNPLAALTPASPVHHQQAEIAGRMTIPSLSAYQPDTDLDEDYDDTAEPFDGEGDPVAAVAEAAVLLSAAPPEPAPAPPIAPAVMAAPRRAVRPRAAVGSKGKAAFTLRLDADRHLKLRLACAVTGRSAQLLVTDALDQLLSAMPELDSMAQRAPRANARTD